VAANDGTLLDESSLSAVTTLVLVRVSYQDMPHVTMQLEI